jgi:hypothetical protein
MKSKAGLMAAGLYFIFAAWTLAIPLFDHRIMAGTAAFMTTLPWSLLLAVIPCHSFAVEWVILLLAAILNTKLIYICFEGLTGNKFSNQ